MTQLLRIAMLWALMPFVAHAASPPAASPHDVCLMLNNRILGPRTQNRPLPLLAGNRDQGFRRACSVPWSTLNPKNEALPVQACFRGSLLQIANTSACGAKTGPLWVDARWVVTSADLMQPATRIALCQRLETGAFAGTRAFSLECAQQEANAAAAASGKPKEPLTNPDRAAPAPAATAPAPASAPAPRK